MPGCRRSSEVRVRGAKCRDVADKADRVRAAKCRDVADKAVLMVQSAEPLLALHTRLRKTSTRSLYAGRGRGDNLVGEQARMLRRV